MAINVKELFERRSSGQEGHAQKPKPLQPLRVIDQVHGQVLPESKIDLPTKVDAVEHEAALEIRITPDTVSEIELPMEKPWDLSFARLAHLMFEKAKGSHLEPNHRPPARQRSQSPWSRPLPRARKREPNLRPRIAVRDIKRKTERTRAVNHEH